MPSYSDFSRGKLGEYEALLRLFAQSPSRLWHILRYGVKALVALGRFEEALDFAEAARDLALTQPAAALDIALASLRWISEGWGYEVTGIDVYAACSSALKAGKALGRSDDNTARRIAEITHLQPRIHELCRQALAHA